ncbi:MAG: N-6 DNA methylase [Ruminococcus sp.]|nr:N-6 DNA methylase [Ruminococcus sp.]
MTPIQELRQVSTKKALSAITGALKGAPWLTVCAAAYIIARTEGRPPKDLNAFLEQYPIKAQLSPALFSAVGDKWDVICQLSGACSPEECRALLLFGDIEAMIGRLLEPPAGLAALSARLLEISPGETVADLSAGLLTFLRKCAALGADGPALGSEPRPDLRSAAMMRADLLGGSVTITSEDPLELTGSFDKIFCQCQFGAKWKLFFPDCGHSASADWLFAKKCMELLSPNGKAVCIFSSGSTWNLSDRKQRESFIDAGYIETVIALPPNIYSSTAVPSTLVILSHGNSEVSFVDATEIFTPSRRRNVLSEEDISQILAAVGRSGPVSCTVSNEEIAAGGYRLSPKDYTEEQPAVTNAVAFSELIARITRGAQIKASELDGLVCEEETGARLLMLSDMSSGRIAEELPYLRRLDKRHEKYCAGDGDLILSKNGCPVKCAVAQVSGEERLLVNGNLYIIQLDRSKAEPYYIKAFFDSEPGQALLKGICVGVTIPNIPIEALKNLKIPMCSLAEQKRIAQRYVKKQAAVIRLQKQLESAEQELRKFF